MFDTLFRAEFFIWGRNGSKAPCLYHEFHYVPDTSAARTLLCRLLLETPDGADGCVSVPGWWNPIHRSHWVTLRQAEREAVIFAAFAR